MTETNELTPEELEWLELNYIDELRNVSGQLNREPLGAFRRRLILRAHLSIAGLYDRILRHRKISPEDRMPLINNLIYTRTLLLCDVPSEDQPAIAADLEFIERLLKRLSKVDWESLDTSEESYQYDKVWKGFRLSEEEMKSAISIVGIDAECRSGYKEVSPGAALRFVTTKEDAPSYTYTIRVSRVHVGITQFEGLPDGRVKFFEGEIFVTGNSACKSDEAFGFIFPNGVATLVDNCPTSDFTRRAIDEAVANGIDDQETKE